jgi:hypothetical protein
MTGCGERVGGKCLPVEEAVVDYKTDSAPIEK